MQRRAAPRRALQRLYRRPAKLSSVAQGLRWLRSGDLSAVTEASSQWTGAAFEALGGVRVHFAPFQAQRIVRKSVEPLEGVVTRPNGFLAPRRQLIHSLPAYPRRL